MTRIKLQRGRFLFTAIVALGLFAAAGGAMAQCEYYPDSMAVEDFEFYADTDELRMTWVIIDESKATVDLAIDGTAPGSAYDGTQYLRLNYLTSTAVGRMLVDPPQDWSCYDYLRIAYRGRPGYYGEPCGEANGSANLRIQLVGDGGSSVILKPTAGPVVNATQCSCYDGYPYCPWKVLYVKMSPLWPGKDSVEQLDLLLTDFERNGELYIDEIWLLKDAPVPVETSSWGAIKALYR